MKRYLNKICIAIYFLSSLFLYAKDSLDLLEKCKDLQCSPRTWYIAQGFSANYIRKDYLIDKDWKEASKFPIYPWEYFSSNKLLEEYTLLVEFDLPEALFDSLKHKGIAIGGVGEVFEVYLNGVQIAKEGKVENEKIQLHRALRGQVFEVNQSYLQREKNRLLIHLWGRPGSNNTGLYFTKGNEFGYFEELIKDRQERVTLILIGIYIVIALYHLFLYLNHRKERYNLYFGLYSLFIGIYFFTRTNTIFELNIDTLIIRRIEYSVLYLTFITIFIFTELLFYDKLSKLIKIFTFYHLLISILTLFLPEFIFKRILSFWQITALFLGFPILFYLMFKGIRDKNPSAKRILFGTILLVSTAVFDLIDARYFGTGISYTKYGFCFYILGIATILAKKFTDLHDQTEELNATLEERVEDRTKKLEESFNKINELKNQQDADYYLTKLLIESLANNNAIQDKVKVDFFIKQKKEFQFQERVNEIGGDICKTESIFLSNRKMTVFLNADAMGKSMQGAGGILVLGAVFKSIIERTSYSDIVKRMSPERWLKNSFVELHKVFESFDGSMLVSIILGLIDEKNGLMYFINAEHPSTILYRDKKAVFVGDRNVYQKLGSQLTDGFIRVQVFPLRKGDIILNGSDGRDDILLIKDNNEVMNSDESLILKLVEEAEANLEQIFSLIQDKGSVIDDFSMMRIEWNGEEDYNFEVDYNLGIGFIFEKKDKEAYSHLSRYLEYHPEDTVTMQILAECLNRLELYEEAIELSERVRIREPKNISNLITLIESYAKISKLDRVDSLIKNIYRLDPKNQFVKKYKR
jgi:hypothetical protein